MPRFGPRLPGPKTGIGALPKAKAFGGGGGGISAPGGGISAPPIKAPKITGVGAPVARVPQPRQPLTHGHRPSSNLVPPTSPLQAVTNNWAQRAASFTAQGANPNLIQQLATIDTNKVAQGGTPMT